jgi:hypothetical protein
VLRNGQTIEVVVARAGSGQDGPSRDWLNPQLGFVRSPRARAKVRQWFNALELARDLANGRDKVERVLQREGRTALALDELARRLKLASTDELFLAVNREEIGPRMLEEAVREAEPPRVPEGEAEALQRLTRPSRSGTSGASPVLVVGVDFLMTQLARCCRPAPPDPIVGFVTRGRGVSVHRLNCRSFAEMARHSPERVLETALGDWQASTQAPAGKKGSAAGARREAARVRRRLLAVKATATNPATVLVLRRSVHCRARRWVVRRLRGRLPAARGGEVVRRRHGPIRQQRRRLLQHRVRTVERPLLLGVSLLLLWVRCRWVVRTGRRRVRERVFG